MTDENVNTPVTLLEEDAKLIGPFRELIEKMNEALEKLSQTDEAKKIFKEDSEECACEDGVLSGRNVSRCTIEEKLTLKLQ
jgi:hypothetical protein